MSYTIFMSAAIRSVGLPKMLVEPGEKRVFLPALATFFKAHGVPLVIEDGYGGSLFCDQDYLDTGNVIIGTRVDACKQDLVLILRSPSLDEFELLGEQSTLMSMLHFPTRPNRIERLTQLNMRAISLDSIANDKGIRLVEDMRAVAWNGLEAAFDYLETKSPDIFSRKEPIQVLILGTGMVGKHAVEAATKLGIESRFKAALERGISGAIAISVGRTVSQQPIVMQDLLARTDILVDATQRPDASSVVIPNEWIATLPNHAVVVDLSVDPYDTSVTPFAVKGIEGVPQGNLDQYVIEPQDSLWDKTVPNEIASKERRTTVSCYSWPGVHPLESMKHYQEQLEPMFEVLIEKGYDGLQPTGTFFERALWRGSLKGWKAR
jgi:alanine dehydrogenase